MRYVKCYVMSSISSRLKKRGTYTKHRQTQRRNKKMSSTPGIMKVETCHKAGWKNLYCSARGYKHPLYSDWCEMIDKLNR